MTCRSLCRPNLTQCRIATTFDLMLHIVYFSLFCRIHPIPLAFTSYGKPNPFVYGNAETVLRNLMPSYLSNLDVENTTNSGIRYLKTLYMIGDNPKIDIRGAREVYFITRNVFYHISNFISEHNHQYC